MAIGDDSRMLAYAIFCQRDSPDSALKLKRIQLVDFQVLDGNMQLLVGILAWGLAKCQEEDVHMLEAFGFRPEKQAVIDSLAPYRRKLPSWWYFYKPTNKALGAELQDPAAWDPSHFDGDTSL